MRTYLNNITFVPISGQSDCGVNYQSDFTKCPVISPRILLSFKHWQCFLKSVFLTAMDQTFGFLFKRQGLPSCPKDFCLSLRVTSSSQILQVNVLLIQWQLQCFSWEELTQK